MALAPGLGGCGGPGAGGAGTDAASREAAAPNYISTVKLRRQLGNAFSAGLYRLAVMSQPPDAATDLGQDLPTGSLSRVSCASGGDAIGGPATRISTCTVRWRTVEGQSRFTRYLVRSFPAGCFAAGARPRFPDHRDPTIEGYSEHPLNALVSAERSCS